MFANDEEIANYAKIAKTANHADNAKNSIVPKKQRLKLLERFHRMQKYKDCRK